MTGPDWTRLAEALGAIVGKKWVRSRRAELVPFRSDGLPTHEATPALAVLPGSRDEVIAVLRLLHQERIPFVARGAGTGLSGGALAEQDAVLLVLTRMNRILSVDGPNRRAVVQPGVVNARLSEAVLPAGLYYAPDPSSQSACTLGGNVAENAGGLRCKRYGVTKDYVMGVEAGMADGSLLKTGYFNGDRGFALGDLLVGSEGTLAIITRIGPQAHRSARPG